MSNEALMAFYDPFSTVVLILLGIVAILCLIKSIMGPKPADRIVAVNMMGTITMAMIIILLVKVQEGYLADICIIYAMISFLAVIVLSKVYYGAYKARKKKQEEEKENGNN